MGINSRGQEWHCSKNKTIGRCCSVHSLLQPCTEPSCEDFIRNTKDLNDVWVIHTYIHTYISGLSSSFLETRVGHFDSTFHDAPPGHSV